MGLLCGILAILLMNHGGQEWSRVVLEVCMSK